MFYVKYPLITEIVLLMLLYREKLGSEDLLGFRLKYILNCFSPRGVAYEAWFPVLPPNIDDVYLMPMYRLNDRTRFSW